MNRIVANGKVYKRDNVLFSGANRRYEEWPTYTDEERLTDSVLAVFQLDDEVLEAQEWGGYVYNYEGSPERSKEEDDFLYRTVIGVNGSSPPPKTLVVNDVTWELVAKYKSSGRAACFICGQSPGIEWWREEFEKYHERPPHSIDRCGLCETELEDMPGSIQIGNSYEAVYRTHELDYYGKDLTRIKTSSSILSNGKVYRRVAETVIFERRGPGKFSDSVEEAVYEHSLEWQGEQLGDAETFGHYTFVEYGSDEPLVVKYLDKPETDRYEAAIVREDSAGFVTVHYFERLEEGEQAWGQLEEEYSQWLDEVEDDEYY